MKEAVLVGGIIATVFFTIIYFLILFFFPEWVGISGKDSEETLKAHQEEKEKDS